MPIDDDFQAQEDAFTLLRAKDIEKDNSRIMAAKNFAEQQKDKFDQMAKDLPSPKTKPMNNSVRGSKMER